MLSDISLYPMIWDLHWKITGGFFFFFFLAGIELKNWSLKYRFIQEYYFLVYQLFFIIILFLEIDIHDSSLE